MLREVTALRTLSKTDALVPGFIESNIDDAIDDKQIKPFVVMEFVDGPTLLAAQKKNGPLGIESAIEFTLKLLNTIEIAHSEDTAHRDIKPQNIVLKSASYEFPYVIDFGLSFNQIVDHEEGLTSIRESIGNRFLTLHESESTGSDSKHDLKSDLTLAIGIFFFLLTDKFPEYIAENSANSPHRRHQGILEAKHEASVGFLNQFFDRAFQYNVANRFETVAEVRDRLDQLGERAKGQLPLVDPFVVAREMKQRLNNDNRSFQLDVLEQNHKSNLANFVKYLSSIARNKDLNPISLEISSQQFNNRTFQSIEVVRQALVFIRISIKHHSPRSVCRYFMSINGNEISISFQELFESDPQKIRRMNEEIQKQPIVELFHFFEWDLSHDDQLQRHFGNWFEKASHAIVAQI